jgi:glucose-6-phosphate dehydrogenase assembly protein OpcA
LADEVIDTVVARYPCRAVVVRRDEAVGRKVSAEISALCHLPAPGMPQVCSEHILLRSGRDGEELIPGAVRPLLEADLPVVVWWVGDPREAMDLYRELAQEANRVIADLPDTGAPPEAVRAALDLTVNPYDRDLAYFGITRWRELVAGFFDSIGQEAYLRRIKSVAITADAADAGPVPRISAWLAGWLAGMLGWVPKSHAHTAPARNVATFSTDSGDVTVTFSTDLDADATPARIASVAITAAEEDGGEVAFRLVRLGDQVVVEVDGPGRARLPRMVQAAELTPADRVSAALESAREDPPYRKALPNALWLLEGGLPS